MLLHFFDVLSAEAGQMLWGKAWWDFLFIFYSFFLAFLNSVIICGRRGVYTATV